MARRRIVMVKVDRSALIALFKDRGTGLSSSPPKAAMVLGGHGFGNDRFDLMLIDVTTPPTARLFYSYDGKGSFEAPLRQYIERNVGLAVVEAVELDAVSVRLEFPEETG